MKILAHHRLHRGVTLVRDEAADVWRLWKAAPLHRRTVG